ncbi:MAG: CRISPR-associated endonuclease Cas1 [Acidimicrobiales bacterium]|jgi:CRISPR-associated endonuclease Cas1
MREAKLVPPSTESDDDRSSLQSRLAQTFARDTPNPAVCVADGFGVRVAVDRGRLVVADGIGTHRRERRYSRATHGLSRLVILSSAGTVGLDALRWCAGAGVGVVVLDPFGGELHLTSGGTGNDDPRLRRAQALSMATAAGLEATRYLIGRKLHGQASVAQSRLGHLDAVDTIIRLRDELEAAETLEEIRHLEAVAANVYWNAWSSIEVPFVRKDVPRVPDHWRSFEGRRSAVNAGTARSATDPANALLNYGYRLLEAEGRLACLAVGLDPGLGILHADLKGRDSMVLDVMEAARPAVDGFVLDLVKTRPLMKTDFAEDRRGVVRVLPPLSHRIAEAMPAWATALGPVVEQVARILSSSSAYDFSVPSVLTRDKHKAAARRRVAAAATTADKADARPGPNPGGIASRAKQRQRPQAVSRTAVPLPICRGCGTELPVEGPSRRPRRLWCDACLPQTLQERDLRLSKGGRATADRVRAATGTLPTHDADAQARRRDSNRRHTLAKLAWEAEHGERPDPEWYLTNVAPKLGGVSLPAIAAATGISTSAASKFRRGLRVPAPRHWEALARLVGVEPKSSEVLAVKHGTAGRRHQ